MAAAAASLTESIGGGSGAATEAMASSASSPAATAGARDVIKDEQQDGVEVEEEAAVKVSWMKEGWGLWLLGGQQNVIRENFSLSSAPLVKKGTPVFSVFDCKPIPAALAPGGGGGAIKQEELGGKKEQGEDA